MEIQTRKRMKKANFAENKVSFVRGNGIWTTDVFIANNQAVTKALKWRYGGGLLRQSMSVGRETLPTEG